jgi:3-methyladenine DNA glycosylase AlkD
MTGSLLAELRAELHTLVDEKTKSGFQRFFKEEVKYYGVKTAAVSKLAKKYFDMIKSRSKKEIFDLSEELLRSNYCEEAWIAANWVYWVHQEYEPDDIRLFENWIDRYISNWAACDTLCNHAVGSFIEQYPWQVDRLKDWARSPNLWMRRAAAVTLIIPAKEGKFLEDIFEIADILLKDKEDLVQKGYGWMLKEASRQHQKEVFDYLMQNKSGMPRTALRYAIEKMPPEMKKKVMEK